MKPAMVRAIVSLFAVWALLLPGCAPPTERSLPSPLAIDGNIPPQAQEDVARPLGAVDRIEGRYVVRLTDGAATRSPALLDVLGSLDARSFSHLALRGRTPPGLADTYTFASRGSHDDVMDALYALEVVAWAEPVTVYRATTLPNDPYLSFQWNLTTLGVADLWDLSDGTDVVVAVVDTGVSVGVDGVNQLLAGYDVIDEDEEPLDENGHGTHVAGTVAQSTDNGVGVAGVAPGAAILPVRVLDADGTGTSVGLASGIIWAVEQGADIVNLSLSSNAPSTVVEEACAYAEEAGVLVVAASGNDGFTSFVSYPAAYDTTFAVGATDLADEVAYYSNQGPELDLVAPGGDLTADRNGDLFPDGVLQESIYSGQWGYFMMAGTSMAAPHVSGVAALLVANGITDPVYLRTALTTSAVDLGTPGPDDAYGHGRLDPQAAFDYSPPTEPPPFEIFDLGSRPLGPARSLLIWRTHELSTTRAEGDNGWLFQDNTERHVHRALVRGAPGETIHFEVLSESAEGYEATSEIDVTFLDFTH